MEILYDLQFFPSLYVCLSTHVFFYFSPGKNLRNHFFYVYFIFMVMIFYHLFYFPHLNYQKKNYSIFCFIFFSFFRFFSKPFFSLLLIYALSFFNLFIFLFLFAYLLGQFQVLLLFLTLYQIVFLIFIFLIHQIHRNFRRHNLLAWRKLIPFFLFLLLQPKLINVWKPPSNPTQNVLLHILSIKQLQLIKVFFQFHLHQHFILLTNHAFLIKFT